MSVHSCRALPRIGSRTTGNGWFLEMQTGLPEKVPHVGHLIKHSWDMDGMKGPQMLWTPDEEVTGELQHATGA